MGPGPRREESEVVWRSQSAKIRETGSSDHGSFPIFTFDFHDGGLLVRKADFAFLVETGEVKIRDKSRNTNQVSIKQKRKQVTKRV